MQGVRSTEYRCSCANVKVVRPISNDCRVVVTAGMFNSDGFKRTLLYTNKLRRPSYYTYNGQKAARGDNPQWPEFSF
jgi:hypothetical protein